MLSYPSDEVGNALVSLDQLDEATLKMILTEPKNAIIKQYQCLLKMDNVDLKFEPEAIELIAKEAIKRKTGARALRSIVEELMLNIMYEVPSQEGVNEFTVTAEMVKKTRQGCRVNQTSSKKILNRMFHQ